MAKHSTPRDRARLAGGLALALALVLTGHVAHAGPEDEAVPPVVTEHVDALRPDGFPDRDVTVVLAVTVDAQGHVTASNVLESGGAEFDAAAVTAVQQWSFRPATRGGAAVAAKIRIPFHFLPLPKRLETPHEARQADGRKPATVVPEGGSGDVHVDEVTVYGRTSAPNRGASDMPIHIGELRRIPRQNASDLLKLAPGILLTNEGGDGHAEQVFLRGFDAREGQDIEFSVGGIPINELGNLHANGYADTHFILPELVETLRVVEGPFDPRQGNFAVAGSADYQLGLERRGLTAKGTHGSFGTNRLVLTYGPREASRHTFGGAEYYQTNGFGQNRAAKRGSAMAQYEGHLGERGTYRIFGQGYSVNYGTAGLLRADDVVDGSGASMQLGSSGKKGFYDTYDPNQGGQSTRFSIGADLEHKFDKTTIYQQLFFIMRSMRVQENFTGFLLDVQQPAHTPHAQRGDLIDRSVSTRTLGGRGFARYVDRVFDRRQELELGYFVRYDETDSTQYRVAAASRAPYRLDVALQPKVADIGLYADTALRPLDKVTLRGGIRADFFTYDILNSCAQKSVRRPSENNPPGDASCLSQQDFGVYREPVDRVTTASAAAMPKATLVLGPWAGFNFSASWGRGVRSVDPLYVYQDVKTPFASVTAYETGAEYKRNLTPATTLQARSIFFGTHVDRDLVFNQTEGRNTLSNGTTRTGWVGAVRLTGKYFDESAHVTFVRSTFDDNGLLVPYVPDTVARNDLVFHGDLPWKIKGSPLRAAAGTGTTFVGRRALPYGQRSGVIFTVDASASIGWRNFDIELSSTNLLDSRYKLGEYNFASDWQQSTSPSLVPARHFAAGAPRAMFLTLTVNVGGEKS